MHDCAPELERHGRLGKQWTGKDHHIFIIHHEPTAWQVERKWATEEELERVLVTLRHRFSQHECCIITPSALKQILINVKWDRMRTEQAASKRQHTHTLCPLAETIFFFHCSRCWCRKFVQLLLQIVSDSEKEHQYCSSNANCVWARLSFSKWAALFKFPSSVCAWVCVRVCLCSCANVFFSWRMYRKLSSEGDNTLLMALAEFNVFCVHEEKRKPTFLTYTVNH